MFLKSEAARQIKCTVYRSAKFLKSFVRFDQILYIFSKSFQLLAVPQTLWVCPPPIVCCFRRHCWQSVCDRARGWRHQFVRSLYICHQRPHGIAETAVFHSVVISRLTYATPAWCGFTTSADRQRIDAVLRRAVRTDLWSSAATSEPPTFGDLCSTADDELFNKIVTNSNHIVHTLLPPSNRITTQHYTYTLLDGAHIHCNYLDIPLISLTATLYYACCTKKLLPTLVV